MTPRTAAAPPSYLLAFALLLLVWTAATTAADPEVPLPQGAAALVPSLTPGTLLLLGELHGTVEAPAFVSQLVKLVLATGVPVTLALEIPRRESARTARFLASPGTQADRTALLAGPFWQSTYQDGRRSVAMADLLEEMRKLATAGKPVQVVFIDGTGAGGGEREEGMARALAAAVKDAPRNVTINLVGNIHARLARGGVRGISGPMAIQVQKMLPDLRIVALKLTYSGGTAWICNRDGCGADSLAGRDSSETAHVRLADSLQRDGYHGVFHVGAIHASPPAEPSLRNMVRAQPVDDGAALMSLPDRTVATSPSGPQTSLHDVGVWPQWMGPAGDGALDVGLLPRGVDVSLELDWRRPIGSGYSSITLFGGRALTLEADGKGIWVLSVDVNTGDEVWRTPLFDPENPAEEHVDSPTSTPTTDGERVFVIHPSGRLFALSADDGGLLWSVDMAKEFGASPPSFGMSTSPVLRGGKLHVLVGGREGFNVLAFHPETGEVLMAVGHGSQGSYATPVMGEVGGARQWVVPAGDRLYGMSAEGDMLWSQPGLPYPDRDPLLLPDDRIFLALQEFGAMLQVTTEPWAVRELWRSELLSNSYSPVVHHQGAVFGFGGGSLYCLAAATGEALWRQRFGDGALVRLDDHLVILNSMSGKLSLVAASREGYREVASLRVFPSGRYSLSPPSIGAGRIFLRGAQEMAAVRIALPG